jgi:hypothetical protein
MLARVVTFDGVSAERMNEMRSRIQSESPPEGMEPKEMLVLHDGEAEKALVVLLFEDEDAYNRADEVLNAMPAGDTPGQRASVARYDVAMHETM